jgi:hypothetical protein
MDNTTIVEKEFRLPKKFATEWLEALRSGEYKQGEGFLYQQEKNSFCCLGVACAIQYPKHYLVDNEGHFHAGIIEKREDQLKYDLKKIPFELKGSASNNNLVSILTGMNDDGNDFLEIADWIEKNCQFYE